MKIVPDQKRTTFVVELDDVTVARLMEVADNCHAHPCTLISAMVHDVLEDDELAHRREFEFISLH